MQKAKGINLNENQIKCSNNYTIFGYLIGIILVYSIRTDTKNTRLAHLHCLVIFVFYKDINYDMVLCFISSHVYLFTSCRTLYSC